MCPLPVAFVGGATGPWGVERVETIAGPALAPAARLTVLEGSAVVRGGTGMRPRSRNLTWFEFAPPDAASFEELVQRLNGTEE